MNYKNNRAKTTGLYETGGVSEKKGEPLTYLASVLNDKSKATETCDV